jgi:hypothetical protein
MNWRAPIGLDFVPREIEMPLRERRDLWRRAAALPGARATGAFIIAAIVVTGLVVFIVAGVVLDSFFVLGPASFALMTVPLFVTMPPVLGWIAGYVFWRPYVYKALFASGHQFCFQCRYRLDQLPDVATTCPECGSIFKPEVCSHCLCSLRELEVIPISCPKCGRDVQELPRLTLVRFRLAASVPSIPLHAPARKAIDRATYGPYLVRRILLVNGILIAAAMLAAILFWTFLSFWFTHLTPADDNRFPLLVMAGIILLWLWSLMLMRHLHTLRCAAPFEPMGTMSA